ncbi:unnamed protein product [Sphagnum balticum]
MKVNVPNEYAHALPTDDAVRRRIRSQRFKARGGQLAAVEHQQLADVHDVPASVVNVDWGHGRVECVLKTIVDRVGVHKKSECSVPQYVWIRQSIQLVSIRGRAAKGAPQVLAIVLLVDATGECDYDRMHQMLLESTGGRFNPRRLFCDRQTDIGASARKTWPSLDVSDIF